jgi:hypothetical protein
MKKIFVIMLVAMMAVGMFGINENAYSFNSEMMFCNGSCNNCGGCGGGHGDGDSTDKITSGDEDGHGCGGNHGGCGGHNGHGLMSGDEDGHDGDCSGGSCPLPE